LILLSALFPQSMVAASQQYFWFMALMLSASTP
jgi:hypothetical protein